jgi:GT2 family glycosyltransferase
VSAKNWSVQPAPLASAESGLLLRVATIQGRLDVKIRWVVGSRKSEAEFMATAATWKSLVNYRDVSFELRLFSENRCGLAEIYNIAIKEAVDNPAILVFGHDDLHVLDCYWPMRLIDALQSFQIVGLIGTTRRFPHQSGWCYKPNSKQGEPEIGEIFAGAIGHGMGFPPRIFHVFSPPTQVQLLDGLLLACHSKTLLDSGLRFDERFDFHFYDLDFCRQAELMNLTMGTCALSVIHESDGNFKSDEWKNGYQIYLDKWKE